MKQFNVAIGLILILYGNAVAFWGTSMPYNVEVLGYVDGLVFALLGVIILFDGLNRNVKR